MRTLNVISCAVVALACLAHAAPSSAIENVRGKEYHLTQKHGPWMIMVASFSNVRDEAMKKDGLTADQAAAELVYELRAEGIPAYTYAQDAKISKIDTQDRLGRNDRRIYAAQRDMICVLAGNYESIEDKVGEKTLKYVKKFQPKFLKDTKSGAIVRADAPQRGPLMGAFMTINPMVDPKDIVHRTVDKDTKILNSGIEYPLIKNPHKYTVQVATFGGKSATPVGNSSYRREGLFESKIAGESGFNLARAGEDAGQLVGYLRREKSRVNSTAPIDEAYVYHDKYESIVTVGGFDSPNDPQIKTIIAYYSPKLVPDLRAVSPSRRQEPDPLSEDELAALPKVWTTHIEQLQPAELKKGTRPLQIWTFDTAPKLIPVPRIK